MALPTNRIKKIKLPNNTEYDIVPTIIQDGSTEYSATLPTLNGDDNIVTTDTEQNIPGNKDFSGNVTLSNNPLIVQADDTTTYTDEDWDASFYPDKVEITNYSENEAIFTLQYPKLNNGEAKTFATTSDLTEIVDLTDLEHASYKFSIVTEDNATYLKVEFSQGYALNYLKFTHSTTVSEVNMLLENNQYSIGSGEEVGNIFYHMTSKTNGGLENWMIVEGLYFTPETQLDEITINDISFYKVEGTFDFEN